MDGSIPGRAGRVRRDGQAAPAPWARHPRAPGRLAGRARCPRRSVARPPRPSPERLLGGPQAAGHPGPPLRHRPARARPLLAGALRRARGALHRLLHGAAHRSRRRTPGAAGRFLRRLAGHDPHAHRRRPALLPLHLPGPHHQRHRRPRAAQHHHQLVGGRLGRVRARGPGGGPVREAARLRAGGGGAGDGPRADTVRPRAAERGALHHHRREPAVLPVHRGGGRHLLPGLRRPAPDAGVGEHALREPRLPLRGLVARRLPGRGARPDGAGHQPGGRLAARRPRPQAAGLDSARPGPGIRGVLYHQAEKTALGRRQGPHPRRIPPMRQLRSLVLLAALLCLSMPPAGPGPAQAQDRARAREVIVAFAAEPRSLLPNTIVDWTTNDQVEHMYDRLVDRDPKTYKPAPMLATGWKVVNDTTWEFALRQGVKFHNGEPFNAASVKATMEYIKDPANKTHYLPRWAQVKEVQIVNDYTVRFITEKPWPGLIDRIASTDFLPMPPKALKEQGVQALAAKPSGTGPFKFVQWVRDEKLVLEKNPDYWQGAPDLT